MQPEALMQGRRGLIVGVANDHSSAWGIARVLAANGAEMAFTYQGDAFGKRVIPLAESLGSTLVFNADAEDPKSLDAVFGQISQSWGGLDFLVHAIAWSEKGALAGRYLDTDRETFRRTLDISCYSFTDLARRAAPLMREGGSLLTLSFLGSARVMPNYNVMGVAKAALEASVRYLANDFGPQGIRVNALSPGPMRTLAGAIIAGARTVYRTAAENAPLRRNASTEEVGNAALFLLSPLGSGVTGEVIFVDSGYHVLGMPLEENL